jgi:two-component system NtrC family sensor kinase
MWSVRIGTRLTFVLLMALTPVLAAYTYWSLQRSTTTYVNDLKREARAMSRGLAPALENDIREHNWDQIQDVLHRIGTEGTLTAVYNEDGKPWYALPAFPNELAPTSEEFGLSRVKSSIEFQRTSSGRQWFCRLGPLKPDDGQIAGYLLVAQDWTEIQEDLRLRTLMSAVAAISLMALIAAIIPLAIRRYVSTPLAELSRKVMRFSREEELDRDRDGDEVKMLTEEFRRLDDQLIRARADVSEKHRRELELERSLQHADRLATIGTLASGLAHEIGTPMGVIRARAEYLLRNNPGTLKSEEGLEIIISQIDRISRILRMLLDYARAPESSRVACDVRPIVQHALSLIETEAARREVRIAAVLGGEPLMVECNADQLQQVFVNLAMNALDAMEVSGGTFRARGEKNIDTLRVVLTFEDTGPGIALEHQARIFDPFFTTKEPSKGTGMGLAVSQSIIRDHDGEITLDSHPSGTRFVVTMPIASVHVRRKANPTPVRRAESEP